MKKYLNNLITCVICFIFIVILNFALPRLMSGDPVAYLTGVDEESMSVVQYEYYRNALHLNDNIFVQFGYYIKSLFDGSLGYSYRMEATVSSLILSRIGATLQISLVAVVVSCGIALVWGLSAGSKKGTFDKISTTANVIINTLPSFTVGMLLIILFCFGVKIFPYSGLNSPNIEKGTAEYFFDRIYHLILPVTTLTVTFLPSRYLIMRNTARAVLNEKYLLFARQRGLGRRKIKYGYILGNVAQPFIAMVGMSVGASIGGSVVVENLFSIQGMGTLLTDAVYALDYPLMQGVLFVTAFIAVISIIITDVICILTDPKLRRARL